MKKKTLLSLALILGICLSTNAQDKGNIELGGQIGLNISNAASSDRSADSKVSFNVGAFADFYINDRWSIKPKVIYDRKGWSEDITDFKVNYITVPITANYHFGGTRRWYFNFGGYIGVLASAEDTEFGIDLKDSFKSTDFGLAFGIGHRFPIADNVNLFVEYEGQSGLVNIFEESSETVRNGRSALNAGLVFLLN
ncbi:hypothetical protein UJ101_00800 [Flavobacteriaceae bacterium UJ101]|nr:hypothetical protein UJ101_00800 [Flavobacteriaceae bacterium UJ101]